MTTTTNVQQIKVNLMTQQQYDSATKNANEFYVITDGEYAETFTAICYSTTFSEIQTAYNAGKVVTCVYANSGETYILPLNQINSTGAYFGGTVGTTGTTLYKAYCLSDGTWSFSSATAGTVTSVNNVAPVNGNVTVSISSSDVTTALGYTPVNKAGDTMSGKLTISSGGLSVTGGELTTNAGFDALFGSSISKGTTPTSNVYSGLRFNDGDSTHSTWQSKRFGLVESQVLNDGSVKLNMTAYKNEANSSSGASIVLTVDSNGVGTATAPNPASSSDTNHIATTSWVNTRANISQTLQAISTTSSTITLVDGTSLYKLTPSAATTLTFTNSTSASSSKAYTFELCIDMSSTAYAITFPNTVTWQEGETPDLSNAGIYFFAFRTINGGTTWLGNLQGWW